MDARNKVAGTYEYKDADEKRGDVEQHDEQDVQLHWCLADVIGLRVEADNACDILKQYNADSDDVAPEQAAADDEDREPEERAPDGGVACAEGFQHTNHLRALKNDNEQAADHRKARQCHHQREDNPNVDVEQVEPLEDGGVELVDGDGGKRVALTVEASFLQEGVDDVVVGLLQLVEVVDQQLGA